MCFGCMKRLIYFWLVFRSKRRLRRWEVKKISSRLLKIRKYAPNEFARKPRSLKQLKNWKATEFRQFLLYSETMVLKGVLPENEYVHFNSFHIAIRILCNKNFVKNYVDYAEKLLSYFVKCLANLYGKQSVFFNMHGLTHLTDDVRKHGLLDKFSAFKFGLFLDGCCSP